MDNIMPQPTSIVPWGGPDHWVVLEDREQVELYLREFRYLIDKPSQIVCWVDLPSKAAKIKDLVVYFQAMSHPDFRKADRLEHDLRSLKKLIALTIPISFVPGLDTDMLPDSLRRLTIKGNGRSAFPKGRCYPGIQALDAWSTLSTPDTVLKIEPRTFPDLQEIACRLDTRGSQLDVMATYPRLRMVTTGPIKDAGVFPRLAAVPIEYLCLERGSVTSLEGLQGIKGIHHLTLRSMDRLTDISALESCEELEAIEIHYCANLRDHAPLLRIPRLRNVFLFRCRALDPEACAADLAGFRTRIWGCDGSRRIPMG